MPSPDDLMPLAADMTAWRRDFHAHPELGFEETRTAGIVAGLLKQWGIAVEEGIEARGRAPLAGDLAAVAAIRSTDQLVAEMAHRKVVHAVIGAAGIERIGHAHGAVDGRHLVDHGQHPADGRGVADQRRYERDDVGGGASRANGRDLERDRRVEAECGGK